MAVRARSAPEARIPSNKARRSGAATPTYPARRTVAVTDDTLTGPRAHATPPSPGSTGSPAEPEAQATPESPPTPATTWREAPGLLLRGGLIGMAEGVPGISGGTVALIVGLFDRLIDAAGNTVHLLRVALSTLLRRSAPGELRLAARAVDVRFMVPVLAGMAVMLLITLGTVAPLLEQYPVQVNAVFFGMIAVSVLVPLRMMRHRPRAKEYAFMAFGVVAGLGISMLPQADVINPPLWLVFAGAALAINALVLPGLSGSYVLLMLGLYIPVHHALDSRDMAFILTFAAGAAIGLGCFVKLLQWLLHHRRGVTLALLAGLMAGSLRTLWPWTDGTAAVAPPSAGAALAAIGLALAGAAVVGAALWWERRHGLIA